MKASLFAEDEDEGDLFQHQGGMKVSADISSPRLAMPASLGRPSGKSYTPPPQGWFCWRPGSDPFLSAVGGLFQTRFSTGQLSESLRPPPRASPVGQEPPRSVQWKGLGPSSFMLPPRTTEPPIRTVGVRRLDGPVPLKESVTQGKVGTCTSWRTPKRRCWGGASSVSSLYREAC